MDCFESFQRGKFIVVDCSEIGCNASVAVVALQSPKTRFMKTIINSYNSERICTHCLKRYAS
jgi:hypothetical protein